MVGYAFYIDRFAGTIPGVVDRLEYLGELGVTYVHFMPCLGPRARRQRWGLFGDGLPRVSTPATGAWTTSKCAAAALRARGMSLCVDSSSSITPPRSTNGR